MAVKADVSTKWFSTAQMTGLPALENNIGSLISVLDAVLVTGACVRPPDSIEVLNGECTIKFSAGNPYPQHSVIKIENSAHQMINDEWRIAKSTADAIAFAAPGIPDGTFSALGVVVKLAPLGWAKVFNDTNKAAYQSKDLFGLRPFLYIDDSVSNGHAFARGYETMSSISDGINQFPTAAKTQTPYWPKSINSSASRHYVIAGNSKIFHYAPCWWTSAATNYDLLTFGEFPSFNPNDTYNAYLNVIPGMVYPGWSYGGITRHGANYSYIYNFFMGKEDGSEFSNTAALALYAGITGPSALLGPPSGQQIFSKALVCKGQGHSTAIRGVMPGVSIGMVSRDGWLYSPIFETLPSGEVVLILNASENRTASSSPVITQTMALNIYGPWG